MGGRDDSALLFGRDDSELLFGSKPQAAEPTTGLINQPPAAPAAPAPAESGAAFTPISRNIAAQGAKLRQKADAQEKAPVIGGDRSWGEFFQDLGLSSQIGVVNLGESTVGLADLGTIGYAGKGVAAAGYSAKQTKEALIEWQASDKQKAFNKAVADAGVGKGFVDQFTAAVKINLTNPEFLLGSVIESVPSMLAAGGGARAVAQKIFSRELAVGAAAGLTPAAAVEAAGAAVTASKSAILWAGAAGEGALAAGSIGNEAREAGRTWSQYVLPALAGGAATALIGRGVANIPGMGDADTALFTRGLGGVASASGGRAARTAKGMFQEGFLEEMPQSTSEAMFGNLAQGKPAGENLGTAAGQGLVLGMAMGGGMGAVSKTPRTAKETRADEFAKAFQSDIDRTSFTQNGIERDALAAMDPNGPSAISPNDTQLPFNPQPPAGVAAATPGNQWAAGSDIPNTRFTSTPNVTAAGGLLAAIESTVMGTPTVDDAIDAATKAATQLTPNYAPFAETPGVTDTFRTARGSTYALFDDNTTQRNRAGEGADTGLQPRSVATVFMDDMLIDKIGKVIQNEEIATRLVPNLQNNMLMVESADGQLLTTASFSTTPEVGMSPVEIFGNESPVGDRGTNVHFGSTITEVNPLTETTTTEGTANAQTTETVTPETESETPAIQVVETPSVGGGLINTPTTGTLAGGVAVTGTATEAAAPRVEDGETYVAAAVTGTPFTATLLRGQGREDSPYNSLGAQVPILGQGSYTTPDRSYAQYFGPNVTEQTVTLQNPLVISNDDQWRALTKEAGWAFSNPFGQDTEKITSDIATLRSQLEAKGYDGVVIQVPASELTGKTLGKVFGASQVIVFNPSTAGGVPTAETPVSINDITDLVIAKKVSGLAALTQQLTGKTQLEELNPAELTAVHDALTMDTHPLPLPSHMASVSQELYGVPAAVEAAKTERNNTPITDQVNERGVGETPERSMDALTAAKANIGKLNGQLAGGAKTGATAGSLLEAWGGYHRVLNDILASRRENPKLWADYAERQAQVAQMNVGDTALSATPSTDNPFGQPVTILKKNPKTWSVQDAGGTTLNVLPVTLRPIAAAPVVETPTAGTPAGGTPTGGAPTAGTPAGGTPAAGTPVGGAPTGGTPTGGAPAIEVKADTPITPRQSKLRWESEKPGVEAIHTTLAEVPHIITPEGAFHYVRDAAAPKKLVLTAGFASPEAESQAPAPKAGGAGIAPRQESAVPVSASAAASVSEDDFDALINEVQAERKQTAKQEPPATPVAPATAPIAKKPFEQMTAADHMRVAADKLDAEAQRANNRFEAAGESANAAEMEMRSQSNATKQSPDDVALGNQKFIPMALALNYLRELEAIDGSMQGRPAQLGRALDILPVDWDRVLDAAKQKRPVTPQVAPLAGMTPMGAKSAKQSAKEATLHTAASVKEGLAGLDKLFGRKGTLGSGPVFDEETWAAAKPHFQAAFAEAVAAGQSLKEFVRKIITEYNEAIIPYLKRWHKEVSSYDSRTETQGDGTLAGVAPAKVGGAGERGPGGRGTEPSGKTGGDRNPAVDGPGGETGRGRRDSVAATDSTETGKRLVGAGGSRGRGQRANAPKDDAQGGFPLQRVEARNLPLSDYTIGDEVSLGSGGQMAKYRDNIAAIKLIKQLEAERRRASPEEQRTLARYVGWGGIPNAFKNSITGEVKDDWAKEVAELESLLTPKELRAASASTRNAHFTSKIVVDFMWRAAARLGFNGGLVLEPSVGSGNFIGLIPGHLREATHITGIELDSLTARIAGALYPRSNIVQSGFEKLPLPNDQFDLAIGNPPFGAEGLRFKYSPELNGSSIHNQFFRASMDAVRPGGLQIMVVSRFLMDKQGTQDRLELAKNSRLLGAIRLPGMAFKGNALTEVVTDILFLQKRSASETGQLQQAIYERGKKVPANEEQGARRARVNRADLLEDAMLWVETGSIADPSGGEAITVNRYFIDNPNMIAGVIDRSGSMRVQNDIDVKLSPGTTLEATLDNVMRFLPDSVGENRTDEINARTVDLHHNLGESLSLYATGAEEGSIRFEPDGRLTQVIERVGQNGEMALTKIDINAATPWSPQLSMNLAGKWFRVFVPKDAQGRSLKVMVDGKATKLNVKEREVFESEADVPNALRLGDKAFAIVGQLIAIRDLLVAQLNLETNSASSAAMEGNRIKLRAAYEAFVKDHGYISEPKNSGILADMPDEGLLMSLEQKFKREVTSAQAKTKGVKASPARAEPNAILSRPVGIPPKRNDHADSIEDAVAMVLSESGRLDIDRIKELRGLSQEGVISELTEGKSPLAYADPEQGGALVEKNAYLSGNVRRKLEAARGADAKSNIEALEAVQPEPWTSDKVTPKIGSTWIPAKVYADFVNHLLGVDNARVTFSSLTNNFQIYASDDGAAAQTQWGTPRMPAPQILQNMMNSKKVAVYEPADRDGGPYFNEAETDKALDKQKKLLEEFDTWIFRDADRRQALTQLFNDEFNVLVNRQHDGAHMKFPGKVPDEILAFRRGQTNAIWRGVVENFVLYDHAVGAGKTFVGIARAMERRRMGLSKKPMIVVPNHLVREWEVQTYRLYPGAKVLAATKKDLDPKNRRRLFAKIAAGDWDIVIVPHSSFGIINLSPETEERFLQSQLELANAGLTAAEAEAEPGRFKSLGVKSAEALIKKIENRMDAARSKKRDQLVTFEQMGVDDLTVDESHEFKNLQYSSSLTGVRGMGNPAGSDKALDMYMKIKLLRENKGSVAFMTGTPISNSAVEMYSIMRYLAPDLLNEMGLEHFDAFRTMFVDASTAFEPTDTGGSIHEVSRLGRPWSNMRALMDAYYSFSDVVTNDDIKQWYSEDHPGEEFPLPRVKGGERRPIAVPPTPTQLRVLLDTFAQYDSLPNISDIRERNASRLRLMDRARKVSLHVRAVDPTLTDEPGGKLDRAVVEIKRIYTKWARDKGTQLVFLDRGVPKSAGDAAIIKAYGAAIAARDAAEASGDQIAFGKANDTLDAFDANEIAELRQAQTSTWNGYQHIKDGLVAAGIPDNEIAFVQNYNSDLAKEALFTAVNDGSIRVLIGSTPRMGAGTNVQERLVALHHIDATWKPSDIEQREGRIIRQGNSLYEKYNTQASPFEVEILAYVTERTVDAKLWSLNSAKLKMVNGIRYYDGSFEMDFEDADADNMAELSAIASGDPLMLERVQLISEVDKLYRQKRSFNRAVEAAKDSITSANRTLENGPAQIIKLTEQGEAINSLLEKERKLSDGRSVTAMGKTFTSYDSADWELGQEILRQQNGDDNAKIEIDIGGKTYTSRSSANEALSIALGDRVPFRAEANGKEFIRRSDFARAILASIGDVFEAGISKPIGKIAGIPVTVETSTSSWQGATVEIHGRLPINDNGGVVSISAARRVSPDKHKDGDAIPLSVMSIRPILVSFMEDLEREGKVEYALNKIKQDMANAKRDLPIFDEAAKNKYKREGEYEKKRDRRDAVEAEIEARGKPVAAPSLSRAVVRGGQTAEAVRSQLVTLEGINVQVVQSTNQLPEASAPSDVEGVWYSGNTVYLVADNLPNATRVQQVLAHEAIGHAAMEAMLGPKLMAELINNVQNLEKTGQRLVRDVAAQVDRTQPGLSADRRAKEIIAVMAERGEHVKGVLWQRAIYAVRQWLRSKGFDIAFSESDVLAALRDAETFAKQGPTPSGVAAAVANAFPQYSEGVSAADLGREKTGQLYEVYNRRTGKVVGGPYQTRSAARKGVDRKDNEYGAYAHYVREIPAKPSEPQYSIRSVTNDVMDYTAQLLHTDQTFNWWHRSVGTQQHKAFINAEFAKVYNEGQKFLADVSTFANTAADEALSLLPRIERFRDFAKKSPSEADVKSAMDATMAGTLYGGGSPLQGRKWNAGELAAGRADDALPGSAQAFTPLTPDQIKLYFEGQSAVGVALGNFTKGVIHRLTSRHGVAFDVEMSLEDGAELVREQLQEKADQQTLRIDSLRQGFAALNPQDPLDVIKRNRLLDQVATAESQRAVFEGLVSEVTVVEDRATSLKDHGYFPAMRFGRFAVYITHEDPVTQAVSQVYFGLFENQTKANLAAMALAKEYPGDKITRGAISQEQYALFQGLSLDALENFADHITDTNGNAISKDPLVQGFLKAAVAERSALKRQIHRKGVAGYSDEMPRVLASYILSMSRTAASYFHSTEMDAYTRSIKDGSVKDEAIKLVNSLKNPVEEAQAIRGLLFTQFLGGSIAHGIINAISPINVTFPYLSQYTTATDAGIKIGVAAFTNVNKLTGDVRDAYLRAKKEGVVAPQEIHQLRAESGGAPIFGNSLALRKFSFAWGAIYAVTEQMNRTTTFLAAYNIAKEANRADAYEFAVKAVNETQFVYNKGNRPNWARGAIGATIFTFKQFSISYLELAKRMYDLKDPNGKRNLKPFALLLLLLLVGGGAEGLPFAEDMEDLVDTIGQWLGYATNSKKWVHKFFAEAFGSEELGRVASRGISGFNWMPVDVSLRFGMGNLIPGTTLLKPSEKNKAKALLEFAGPIGQFVPFEGTMGGKALEKLRKVDFGADSTAVAKGVGGSALEVAPVAVQNLGKGVVMAYTGQYPDARNRQGVKVTGGEAALKMIGLQPSSVANQAAKLRDIYEDIAIQRQVEGDIVESWANAIVDKNPSGVNRAKARVREWNSENPQLKIAINNAQLNARVIEMRIPQNIRIIRNAPRELRGSVVQDLAR